MAVAGGVGCPVDTVKDPKASHHGNCLGHLDVVEVRLIYVCETLPRTNRRGATDGYSIVHSIVRGRQIGIFDVPAAEA